MVPIPEPAARSWKSLKVIFFHASVSSSAGYGLPRSQASDAYFSAFSAHSSLSRILRLWLACVVITPRWYSKYISLFHVGIATWPSGGAAGALYPLAVDAGFLVDLRQLPGVSKRIRVPADPHIHAILFLEPSFTHQQ